MTEVADDDRRGGWAGLAAIVVALLAWRFSVLFGSDLTLGGDEAQYWTWAQDLAFGYYSKPPLLAWAIAATTAVCGDGPACVRAAAPLTYAIGAVFLFLLARDMAGRRAALWTAALWMTIPGVAFSSMLITTDTMLLMCWAAGVFAAWNALKTGRMGWWVAVGLAFGLGLNAKQAMLVFAVSLALVLLLDATGRMRAKTAGPWIAIAVGAALLVPNLIWQSGMGWPTLAHTGDNANLAGALLRPEKMLEFLGAQFGVFGPPTFFALIWCVLWRGRTTAADPRLRFLMCFALPMLLIVTAQSFLSRAHANWAAAAYVAATPLVAIALLDIGRVRVLKVAVGLYLVLGVAFYHFDTLVRGPLEAAGVTVPDPHEKLRGWRELAAEIEVRRAAHPDARLIFDDRMVIASMLYELRPMPRDAIKWDANGRVDDHYEMTTDLETAIGGDAILVALHGPDPRLLSRFARTGPLGSHEAGVGGSRQTRVVFTLLEDLQPKR